MGSLRTFGLLAATALLFVAAPAPSAQQGGTAGVGIIGGVQPGQFPTAGRVKVVQPNGRQFFVPLNGIRNYLVFYAPDANGNDRFAPAGTYSFEYQTSGGSHAIDNGTLFNGSANYQPNFTFSQGGVIVVRRSLVVRVGGAGRAQVQIDHGRHLERGGGIKLGGGDDFHERGGWRQGFIDAGPSRSPVATP